MILAVRVVDDLDQAIAHIQRYGSDHTEVIVTNDYANGQEFLRRVTRERWASTARRPLRTATASPRRGDRHLHLEAARIRPDGPRKPHHPQVRSLRNVRSANEPAEESAFSANLQPHPSRHLRAAEEVRDPGARAHGLRAQRRASAQGRRARSPGAGEPALRVDRRATADNPRFAVTDGDRALGPSYSVDTLRRFGERLTPEKPIFVIGRMRSRRSRPGGSLRRSSPLPLRGGSPAAGRGADRRAAPLRLARTSISTRRGSADTAPRRPGSADPDLALDVSGTDIRRRSGRDARCAT